MRKLGQKILMLLVVCPVVMSADLSSDSSQVLWYETPADHFTQSLPLGNGRLGMMVFGGIEKDRIVLNEESVWSGSPSDDNRPNAHERLPEIRRLLLEGKNDEAERLVNQTFTCKGEGSGHGKGANVPFGCYQVLGNLWIEFETGPTPATHYHRQLDLSTAVADVRYHLDGIRYHRQYFTSAPDQIGVIRLTTDRTAALSFNIRLDRPERFETEPISSNELLMTGQLNNGRGGGGIRYAARIRIVTTGGSVSATGRQLTVFNADTATILFAAETDYHGVVPRDRHSAEPKANLNGLISTS